MKLLVNSALFCSLISMSAHAVFDGSETGCNVQAVVTGGVGQVGVSQELSSLTGSGGFNVTVTLNVTSNTGVDFHVGTPVVSADGSTVAMQDSSEGVFYITSTSGGFSRAKMTPSGLFFPKAKHDGVEIEYTAEASNVLAAGNYTVNGVTSCVKR